MKRNRGGHYSLLFFSKTHLFLLVLWFGRSGPVQGSGSVRTMNWVCDEYNTGLPEARTSTGTGLFRPHPVILETQTRPAYSSSCLFVIPVAPAKAVSIL